MYAQCIGRGTRLNPGKKDCLILDFVDLSELSLCTLPVALRRSPRARSSGSRRQRGTPSLAANLVRLALASSWRLDSFTLPEIQQRAESFDPLRMEANGEVRAISANAWFSLGRHGLGLHFERRPGRASEVVILQRAARGKRWEVSLDGQPKDRFSSIEAAVEAVDYEISRMGPRALASAREEASWRRAPGSQLSADSLRLAVWRRVFGR